MGGGLTGDDVGRNGEQLSDGRRVSPPCRVHDVLVTK